jgi:hypothetical protein
MLESIFYVDFGHQSSSSASLSSQITTMTSIIRSSDHHHHHHHHHQLSITIIIIMASSWHHHHHHHHRHQISNIGTLSNIVLNGFILIVTKHLFLSTVQAVACESKQCRNATAVTLQLVSLSAREY